ESGALGGRERRDIAAVEQNAPGIGRELAGQLSDQRGLAGAVGPDQRVGLAAADAERDIVGRNQRAERLAQVLDLEQELAHGAAPGLLALSAVSGKSSFCSRSFSSAPMARVSMPQMPSRTSSTRITRSGPKNSIQCSV